MREEGKGEGAELQRSVEQWQFTTPPSWGVKCLGKFFESCELLIRPLCSPRSRTEEGQESRRG